MVLRKRHHAAWAALAVAAVLGLGLLAAACDGGEDGGNGNGDNGGNGGQTPAGYTPGQPIELPTVPPGTLVAEPSPTTGAQRAPEEAAAQDLARRFDVAADEIELISVTPMDFPDACLGLGQPGEVCAEVITPGFEVVLGFGESQFIYHTTADGTIARFADVDIPTAEG